MKNENARRICLSRSSKPYSQVLLVYYMRKYWLLVYYMRIGLVSVVTCVSFESNIN